MAGWSGSGEERLHAGRAAPRVCNARPVLGLRSASQSLRRDRKCHTVWPNHSCCGNWNCTLPAFHLACRGGICQKQQTAALSQGQGARLRLRGHREGWEWAALSGAPETMEKSPGGGGGGRTRHHLPRPGPSESLCRPGTELELGQGARPVQGHMLLSSEPDCQFWVFSG